MLPWLSGKPSQTTVVDERTDEAKAGESTIAIAAEMLKAIEAKDVKGVAEALEAAFMMLSGADDEQSE